MYITARLASAQLSLNGNDRQGCARSRSPVKFKISLGKAGREYEKRWTKERTRSEDRNSSRTREQLTTLSRGDISASDTVASIAVIVDELIIGPILS